MIGKPEWFARRKYLGWGAMPRTWQGWLYVAVALAPFILVGVFHLEGMLIKGALALWVVLVAIDVVHMLALAVPDERERLHEAIAERNALWTMLTLLLAGAIYQSIFGIAAYGLPFDPVIAVALAGALIVKAASNVYLDRTN